MIFPLTARLLLLPDKSPTNSVSPRFTIVLCSLPDFAFLPLLPKVSSRFSAFWAEHLRCFTSTCQPKLLFVLDILPLAMRRNPLSCECKSIPLMFMLCPSPLNVSSAYSGFVAFFSDGVKHAKSLRVIFDRSSCPSKLKVSMSGLPFALVKFAAMWSMRMSVFGKTSSRPVSEHFDCFCLFVASLKLNLAFFRSSPEASLNESFFVDTDKLSGV